MTNTLAAPQVTATLSRLFAAAAQDSDASALLPGGAFATASALEKADAAQDVYMPISPEAGQLLYALVRASRAGNRRGVRHVVRHLHHPPRRRGDR